MYKLKVLSFPNNYCCVLQIDSKFTTTTQIVKLVGSHTISRITLRIGDLKRTKMVRNINIYYNNRTVQAVVELKNKPGMLFFLYVKLLFALSVPCYHYPLLFSLCSNVAQS